MTLPAPFQPGAFQQPSGFGPGGSLTPVSDVAVVIEVDGVDVTADVDIWRARFESLVNGQPGTASIRIRDEDRTKSYSPGMPVLLTLDAYPAWRGFVSSVRRVYLAPALNVTDFGLARFIDLDCVDINVLFQKRIVANQSDPANVYGTLFPADTDDNVAIADLIDNFLDLSGDGIDTLSRVEFVGPLDPDQSSRAWSGGFTWGDAMASIAMIPAAIYYIDPSKRLVYTDVDTPNAPFGLSDQPDGVTTFGYREMEILLDGASLANDVLCWGFGYGSNTPVFTRAQAATSQSVHGLWQYAQSNPGVYVQASIDRIADSILNGSPTNHRGRKEDRQAVIVKTLVPGLLPAQKVPFTSAVFGYTATLPVRKSEITFINATTPLYALTLSLDIDAPWGFVDQFLFTLPHIAFPPLRLPGITFPSPGDCFPVNYDDFDRTVSGAWGGPWTTSDLTDAVISVDGSAGVAAINSGGDAVQIGASVFVADSFTMAMRIRCSNFPPSGAAPGANSMDLDLEDNSEPHSAILLSWSNNEGAITVYGSDGNDSIPKLDWLLNGWYLVKWEYGAGGTNRLKIWVDGDPEPGAWDVQIGNSTGGAFSGELYCALSNADNTATYDTVFEVDYIHFIVCGCTPAVCSITDTFDRTTSPGDVGVSTSALPWYDLGGAPTAFCDGTRFNLTWGAAWALDAASPTGIWDLTYEFEFWDAGQVIFQIGISDPWRFIFRRYSTNNDVVVESPDFNTDDSATFSFGTGVVYKTHIQVDAVGGRVNVWPVVDPEPVGWMANHDYSATPPPTMTVEFFNSGVVANAMFAYIDNLDLTGVTRCTTFRVDGFNRIEASDWGTSDSGFVWSCSGACTGNSSVSSGAGQLSVDDPDVSNGLAQTLGTSFAGSWPLTFEFLVAEVPSSGANGPIALRLRPGSTEIVTISISSDFDTAFGSPRGGFVELTGGNGDYVSKTDWLNYNWYTYKEDDDGVNHTLKIWSSSDPEPGTALLTDTTYAAPTSFEIEGRIIRTGADTPGHAIGVEFDNLNFEYTGKPCYQGGPPPGPGGTPVNPSGNGCEEATRLSSTQYQVSAQFVPGTTEVYVDGLRLRGGQALDYIEDPGALSVTFDNPISSGSVVTICYTAAISQSGGAITIGAPRVS